MEECSPHINTSLPANSMDAPAANMINKSTPVMTRSFCTLNCANASSTGPLAAIHDAWIVPIPVDDVLVIYPSCGAVMIQTYDADMKFRLQHRDGVDAALRQA